MKKWLQKNGGKIIIGMVIIAALTAAFMAGGHTAPSEQKKTISVISEVSPDSSQESSEQVIPESHKAVSEEVSKTLPEYSAELSSQPESTPSEIVPSVSESASLPEESSTETEESVQESSDVSEMSVTAASTADESSQESSQQPEESSREEEVSFVGESQCTMYISCKTAMTNEKLNKKTRSLLPEDGWILPQQEVSFQAGESVFDILKRVCREKDIRMEFSIVPLTNGAYIEGIGYLYEFDCGPVSGWMYSVNGEFKSVGCSECIVSDGDSIEWQYSCDLGADIGNYYYGENT